MTQQTAEYRGGTIAVVLKGYPRLSETFIAQELRGLELLGYKLRLVSLRHPTDRSVHPIHKEIIAPVDYLPEYLHQEPWRVLKGVAGAFSQRGFAKAFGRWLKDFRRDFTRNRVRRFGQACVLANELPNDVERIYVHFIHTPAAVGGYASLITGLPWSCSAHAKDIWTSPDWELRQNLSETDWVATCTKVGWQHLQSLSPHPESVHLIYHGLDLERFPSPGLALGSSRDGTSENAPVRLLSVGRAVKKKGFDTLLEALAQLPSGLHWQWRHIGGGGELKSLQALADQLGIADRIEWLGAQPQTTVLETYRQSDLFILPCRIADDGDRDGLPNVLVEAQSQRLACISTPISAIPELITDGESGALVPPNDAAALAGAISMLACNPEKRAQFAAAGEARVRAHFDMAGGLGQLSRLFQPGRSTSNRHPHAQPEAAE